MRQKRNIIGIAIFFTICLSLYAYLGGLEKVVVQYVDTKGYHIIGREYQGDIESNEMKSIFLEFKGMAEKHQNGGNLVVLYYKDAQEGDENIKCFTGLLLDNKPDDIPFGKEYRYFESNGVIRARFDGHRLVTPNPATIKEKATKYAEENNLGMQSLFIEKYFSNNAIEIDYLLF
jgi:hypothetical protein